MPAPVTDFVVTQLSESHRRFPVRLFQTSVIPVKGTLRFDELVLIERSDIRGKGISNEKHSDRSYSHE